MVGVDNNKDVIEALSKSSFSSEEPGIQELINETVKNLNLKELKSVMRENPIIVDCRRIINVTEAKKHGFRYVGTGYGSTESR